MEKLDSHKAGYVSLIGKPNAGKSTLLNSILGEKLVITSPKAQTTRHRILGLYNDDETQIIFSDTPGLIEPNYQLHERMMAAVDKAVKDSDLNLFISDVKEDLSQLKDTLIQVKNETNQPLILVLNKAETSKNNSRAGYWKELFSTILDERDIFIISALEDKGIKPLLDRIKDYLPFHPPFFDKEQLATAQMRFFVSEFIREGIFENYDKEIPYQSTVVIQKFEEKENITKIYAEIVVYRESQKGIIIGKNASKIKKLSTESRLKIEEFLGQKVFLDLRVKVRPKWRDKNIFLDEYGY